jgi:hypothetical protein
MVRRWELDMPKSEGGKRKLAQEVADLSARIGASKKYGVKK